MSSRDNILEKLRRSAPRVGDAPLPQIEDRAIFKDYPDGSQPLEEIFARQIAGLKGEFYRVAGMAQAAQEIRRLIQPSPADAVWWQPHPLLDELVSHLPELRPAGGAGPVSSAGSPELSQCPVGISVADFLVARTGSVVLRNTAAGGRRISVLPPFHIVVARSSQMVPSLDAAIRGLDPGAPWSYAAIISGPSRTSDIEKVLVLGAHGPKRLAVVLVA